MCFAGYERLVPTHRLDRWMRAHYGWLRVATGVVCVLQLAAWWLDAQAPAVVLAVPSAVLVTLVTLYLPRTPLQRPSARDRASDVDDR